MDIRKKIIRRAPVVTEHTWVDHQFHPLLRRIYTLRAVNSAKELSYTLHDLLPFTGLKGSENAAQLLAEAFFHQRRVLIIGDYDADGATSTALAVAALKQMGLKEVHYLVPSRFTYGYGLTPEIVEVARQYQPDYLITVDNGIASHAGVNYARELGIKVIITDHHLPAATLPEANVIVNPNQPGDEFTSKSMAGVGVIFYVMLALRAYLRAQNWFNQQNIPEPQMAQYLDLVALGTIADVVALDHNNRVMVQQGLDRMRAGHMRIGIRALLNIANRKPEQLTSTDLAFAIAPRLNAAGRLDDMSLGIACLLEENQERAEAMAQQLNELNHERKHIEADMQQQAWHYLKTYTEKFQQRELPLGLCLYEENWHQGVIGILAGRIKERFNRPVIVFAKTADDELKGSGRSVHGVHIRDVLDCIATQHPGMIKKFGGHAMAAGLTIAPQNYQEFQHLFNMEVARYFSREQAEHIIMSDGELLEHEFSVECARLLHYSSPWGQAFPAPIFDGIFHIVEQRLVGTRHLKFILQPAHSQHRSQLNAIAFNVSTDQWPNYRCERIHAAYTLDINSYRERESVQLVLEYFEPC